MLRSWTPLCESGHQGCRKLYAKAVSCYVCQCTDLIIAAERCLDLKRCCSSPGKKYALGTDLSLNCQFVEVTENTTTLDFKSLFDGATFLEYSGIVGDFCAVLQFSCTFQLASTCLSSRLLDFWASSNLRNISAQIGQSTLRSAIRESVEFVVFSYYGLLEMHLAKYAGILRFLGRLERAGLNFARA